jgi:hypothetical protein
MVPISRDRTPFLLNLLKISYNWDVDFVAWYIKK